MVTIVDDGKTNIGKRYYASLMRNLSMAEIMKPNDDIMMVNNIKRLPAAIMTMGRVIYKEEMLEYIKQNG